MPLSIFKTSQTKEVAQFFTHVFSDAEGKNEGKVIGDLVEILIPTHSRAMRLKRWKDQHTVCQR